MVLDSEGNFGDVEAWISDENSLRQAVDATCKLVGLDSTLDDYYRVGNTLRAMKNEISSDFVDTWCLLAPSPFALFLGHAVP